MKEYEMLRTEIIEGYKMIAQYNMLLYTATATILVFALKEDLFLLCLIPYLVLVPLFLMCEAKRRGICKIAAYMNVFLEGDEFNWERRHHKLDAHVEKDVKRKFFQSQASPLPYYSTALVCSIAASIKVVFSQTILAGKIFQLIFVIAVTDLSIFVMSKNRVDYTQERDRYVNDWKREKAQEETVAQVDNNGKLQ